MNKSELKCVIFDMDGVIVDTEPLHHKAYFKTFEQLGIEVTQAQYSNLTGSSTINAFTKLVEFFHLDKKPADLVLQKRAIYVDLFENDPSLHLLDGVENLIKHFYNRDLKLVLASSSSMENINRVFKRFDLDQYFIGKLSGADLKESKPNPEIFVKAAQFAKIPTENCIVIEDSDNGVKAANLANIFCVGYISEHSELQKLDTANQIINHFNELIDFE